MGNIVSAPNLNVKVVDDKVLVHDSNADKVHVLNSNAGRILNLCDGTRDLDEISRKFAADCDIAEDVARRDVTAILDTFTNLGLVSLA